MPAEKQKSEFVADFLTEFRAVFKLIIKSLY